MSESSHSLERRATHPHDFMCSNRRFSQRSRFSRLPSSNSVSEKEGGAFRNCNRPLIRPAVRANGCKRCSSATIPRPFQRSPPFHRLFWTARHPASSADPILSVSITAAAAIRSEEHTSELQSLAYLVCRLLLEKKKINK